MNDREWIRRTLAHQETDGVPYYFDFTPPARRKVEAYYGEPIEDALTYPVRMTGLKTIKPLYADPTEFGDTAQDEFGVVWSTSEIDRGVPIRPCLAGPDLSRYTFPDIALPYRFENLSNWCAQNRDHYTIVWVGDLWERATFMRGMENLLMDLVLRPAFVDELLRGITDRVLGTMEILFDRYTFDGIAVSDDYGAQDAMLMSPSSWRRFVRPRLAEIYTFAKTHEKIVFHHSDGDIRPIIRDLIDIGCDILHPVQPETMDVFELKREFGRNLTLWGGMRTQDLLVTGSPEEIRNAVRTLKRELGRGGGYVVGNGITVQADVPLENLVAMIDEGRRA